jgi:GTP:adenosylcobinamide-phosphate guanylyltransferase
VRWGVVVAAGGLVKDPLASAIGTPRKALAVVDGRPCLEWVLEAVREAGFADCVTVSGDDVEPHTVHGRLVMEKDAQIENARIAVEALPEGDAVLFLPADSPFLTGPMLRSFAEAVESRVDAGQERWLAAGLTTLAEFQKLFPGIEPHPINLKDGEYLSGALYAASPAAFLHAISLLDAMSRSRKNQFAMLWKLGPWTIMRYLLHRVSLSDAEQRLGRLFEGQAIVVTGCDPLMAADIDDVAAYDEIRIYANLPKDGPAR